MSSEKYTDLGHMPYRRRSNRWLIALVICVALALMALPLVAVIGMRHFVTSQGNRKEAQVNRAWNNADNYLQDCLGRIHVFVYVPYSKSSEFDKVMADAIKGRFDSEKGQTTDTGNGKELIATLKADNPDVLDAIDFNLMVKDTIIDCRTGFRAVQANLSQKLDAFDAWRVGKMKVFGSPRLGNWMVDHFGGNDFPNGHLSARDENGKTVKDVFAYAAMYRMVQPTPAWADRTP